MKTPLTIVAVALLALAGCRREDLRTFSVEVKNLDKDNAAKVLEAFKIDDKQDPRRFHYYDGIDLGSIKCDIDAKTVTVKYDSMKIAKTNIRMLLEAKGLEVVYPEKKSGVAGYLNER